MVKKREKVTVVRCGLSPFGGFNQIGTEALNAFGSMPGIFEVQLDDESLDSAKATLSYLQSGTEQIGNIAAHLFEYGLRIRSENEE